jgi:hypothetical protein
MHRINIPYRDMRIKTDYRRVATIKIELNHDGISIADTQYRGTAVIVNTMRRDRSADRPKSRIFLDNNNPHA